MKPVAASTSFSLTEILAATAILSVMFAIMFGILQQTSKGWQAANRKVEASQVARLALEQIASDLESCVAVSMTNVPLPDGTTRDYAFGFFHENSPTSLTGMDNARFPFSEGSDLLFVVIPFAASLQSGSEDLMEVGYLPVRATQTTLGMKAGRHYLLRHFPTVGSLVSVSPQTDFLTNPSWYTTPGEINATNRLPFVDNCLLFDVRFVFAPLDGAGQRGQLTNSPTWGQPSLTATNGWAGLPADAAPGLPHAAQITLAVVDDRTAERLDRLRPDGLGADLARLTNASGIEGVTGDNAAAVQATLREGLTILRRTVLFRASQP